MEIFLISKLLTIVQQLAFILLGFFGLGFLIGFHELGHFLFCKLFNISTPSFSIGFGPKIVSKRIGETEFSLSAIPFGGYVEIAGAAEVGQGEQKEARRSDERSFAAKPFYQKLLVLSGGIVFNIFFAYVVMIVLFMTGIPKTALLYQTHAIPVITYIQPDSPAEKYGLEIGDRVIEIANQKIDNSIQLLHETLQPLANKETTIVVQRGEGQISKSIQVGSRSIGSQSIGILGVEFDISSTPPHSFKEAIIKGIQATNFWITSTFAGFAQLFKKKNFDAMAGPIMIVAMTIQGASAGIKIFLLLLAIISVNLAILNIIPLPILDGGQALFYGIEAAIGRPLPEKVREYIHIATWILFLLLFVYLSAQDTMRIASPHIESILKFFGIR